MKAPTQHLFSEYLDILQKALSRCQYIEKALKMYISYCYQIIDLSLGGRLRFNYTYKDVADKPLGTLIRDFKKLNGNTKLVGMLESLVKDRNHCAHNGYLVTADEIRDPNYLSKELARVRAVAEKADLTLKALFHEAKVIEKLKEQFSKK